LALPVPERYPSLEMAPELRRRKTLEVLAAWNLALGELQPMVLLVEDLHWCDPSSLELLGRLVEQSSTARVLLLLTARPEFAAPWPTRSNLTTLQLARLTKRQAREMVAGVSGEALPTEVLETIVARADGVPLYLEELTKAVVEPGAVRSVEAIPATLQDSLMARLDRLSAAKEVAQRAAVLGREFSYALLAASVAIEEAALRRGLVCLVEAEILFARGEPPNATYTFKHVLIQESAYSSLLRRTRLELHGRVVRALVAHFPEQVDAEPEIVARHAERAGLLDEAVTYYQRAGERAVARSALLEAAGHFTTALQLLGTLPNAPGRAQETLDLQVLLGQALAATKGYGAREVTDAFARARELARQVGGTPQLLSVLFGLWTSIAGQGEFRIARDLADELLAVAERARMRAEMVWGHLAHGINHFSLGDAATAREHLNQVVALYKTVERPARPSDPGVMALSYASFNSWTLGLFDEAREHSRESLELAERLRNPLAVAWAGFFTAMLHVVLREPLRALEHAEPVIALCTEHQFSLFVGLTTIVRGAAISEDGRHEEGLAELRKGLGLYFATGQRVSHRLYLALLAQACMAAGAIDEAAATVEEALGMRTDERFFEPELHRLRAELLSRQGAEPARVEGSFRAAIELARRQAARALELRAATSYARWLRIARRADEARQHLDQVCRWFPGGLDIRDLVDAKALLEELQLNS
jgi:predicted ATPase